MNAPSNSLPTGFTTRVALALLALLIVAACEPADPLEGIREQQAAGNFAATVGPLSRLAVERPKDPEINFLYGRALLHSGQAGLATWSLREAMKSPDWRESAGLEIARAGLANLDFNEVIEATTAILSDDPDHVVALLYRAQAQAHWRKNPEKALEDAERVLELDPERLEAYEPLILSLIALGRRPEAEEALEEAGRRLAASDALTSTLAWHCSTTAIMASDAGDVDRARAQWTKCLEEYSGEPVVVTQAIQFYDQHAEWNRSLEVSRAALDAAPGHRGFRTLLADRLRMMGSPAEGEALLREATVAGDPRGAAAAWSDLAIYRHALGDHGAAADALAQAIEIVRSIEEPNPQLLFRYADALVISGNLDRALTVAEEISVPAQRNMIEGRVAQERRQYALALERFDEALRVWPNNAFARYYAALAAEQVGDFDRALEEYRYALRIEVGATDARSRAARLLVAEHQPMRAYQLLFLERKQSPLDPAGELLAYYLMGRVGTVPLLQGELKALSERDPVRFPYMLAEAARGVEEVAGPRAAMNLLRTAPSLDESAPASAPALRALVRAAHEAGDPDVAARVVEVALTARPQAAVFHALQGLHLELMGAEPERVREAYERAVALNSNEPAALAGLGRLTLDRDPALALALFDRASAADPSDPGLELSGARALRASGEIDGASERLDALLAAHPYDAPAAREQVSLDLERGEISARTLDRARRAVRFGREPEDYDQLARVYAALDQPDSAKEASRRAELLRAAVRAPEEAES